MWLTLVDKFLDFLKAPTALGVIVVFALLALVIYVLPLAVVAGVSYDNTNRLQASIERLASNCLHRTAERPHQNKELTE